MIRTTAEQTISCRIIVFPFLAYLTLCPSKKAAPTKPFSLNVEPLFGAKGECLTFGTAANYWPLIFLNNSRRLLYLAPHSNEEMTRKSAPGSGVHFTSRLAVQ